MCIYIKGCGTQPGLGELKHEGLLLRQEQVYKVYKGKNQNILPSKWDGLMCIFLQIRSVACAAFGFNHGDLQVLN